MFGTDCDWQWLKCKKKVCLHDIRPLHKSILSTCNITVTFGFRNGHYLWFERVLVFFFTERHEICPYLVSPYTISNYTDCLIKNQLKCMIFKGHYLHHKLIWNVQTNVSKTITSINQSSIMEVSHKVGYVTHV